MREKRRKGKKRKEKKRKRKQKRKIGSYLQDQKGITNYDQEATYLKPSKNAVI